MHATRFPIVVAILLSLALVGPLCVNGQPQLPGAPGQCNSGCCNLGRTVFEGACSSFVSGTPGSEPMPSSCFRISNQHRMPNTSKSFLPCFPSPDAAGSWHLKQMGCSFAAALRDDPVCCRQTSSRQMLTQPSMRATVTSRRA